MNFRELKRTYWYPISVDIERALRKVRIKIDRLYKKIWIYLFTLLLLPYVGFASYRMYHDYSLINNYANLDAPFAPAYTEWRTDGSPGQPAPEANSN